MYELMRGQPMLGMTRSAEQVWYRCRKCESEEGYANVSQMIYPAQGNASYGRANLPGQSVLYAAWNVRTAMEEISFEVGDTIQLIALRVLPGLQFPCHIVGEYQCVTNSGGSLINSHKLVADVDRWRRSDPSSENITLLIDSFIAEQYRQTVSHPTEHKFTALYADQVYKGDGGIMYPSVASNRAINIAVPGPSFDANFEVLFTEVLRIEKYYGYGIFEQRRLKGTCEFADDGAFVWASTKAFDYEWALATGMRLQEGFRGWRTASARG